MPTIYGPHIPYKQWFAGSPPDPTQDHMNWLEVERWAARLTELVTAGQPTAMLKGNTQVTSGIPRLPPAADYWWQAVDIDQYVTVADRNSGHGFTVLRDCSLAFTLETDLDLQSGTTGSLATNIDVYRLTGSGSVDDTGGWNGYDGPWSRAAFPSAAQTNIGFTTVRTFTFAGGSTWAVEANLFNDLGYSRNFDWKLTAGLLAPVTLRTLPGQT